MAAATISKVESPARTKTPTCCFVFMSCVGKRDFATLGFMKNFPARTMEEFQKLCPLGSKENAFYRMVVSYWEMAASFVTGGILHQTLFTQNSRELLFVWERIRNVAPALRETFNNSNIARNMETLANAMIEDRLPDSAFGV